MDKVKQTMKSQTVITGLILGFLLGCSETQNPPITQPTPTHPVLSTQSTNEFESFTDPQSIAEAALLTPEQVKQLVAMDGNNSKDIEFKVIVPTYIPAGFKVEKVETLDRPGGPGGPAYQITYRNSRNACFSVSATSGGWGSGPGEQHSFEVNPPALGKLLLGYTEFFRSVRRPSISFQGAPIIKGKQGYFFNSPAIDRKCDVIEIQDGIKIANSLQYLNP